MDNKDEFSDLPSEGNPGFDPDGLCYWKIQLRSAEDQVRHMVGGLSLFSVVKGSDPAATREFVTGLVFDLIETAELLDNWLIQQEAVWAKANGGPK
jgi:hypothetical protein